MASVASDSVWYVYGIVSDDAGAPASAPSGLDDADVRLERAGGLAAIVSVLGAEQYGAAALETNTGDVDWLGPRAVAHDRVLTWASDRGAVVPLPMFSVFSGAAAVHAMLRERAGQLTSTLERVRAGREYALRVYRIDAELLAGPAIGRLSPRIQALEDTAAAATPGQRYLLERKLDVEKRSEIRAVSTTIVDEIVASLQPHALGVVRTSIPRATAADPKPAAAGGGTMVLNAAFLVAPTALSEFQRALTALVEQHGGQGFRFDFTGPWPPYHFVGEDADGR